MIKTNYLSATKSWMVEYRFVLKLIFVVVVAVASLLHRFPEYMKVAVSFVEAVQLEEVDKAYNLTSADFRRSTSREDLASITGKEWALLPKEHPSYSSEVFDETASTSLYRVLAVWPKQDGGSYQLVILVNDNDGVSKIVGAQSYDLAPGEEID